MGNYKICKAGVLDTTVISMSIGSERTQEIQGNTCTGTKRYRTLRFTSTKPADDNLMIFYTYSWKQCYSYSCLASTDYDTGLIGFVSLPAGSLVVEKEVPTYEYWCCEGDGSPDDNDGFLPAYDQDI